MQTHSSMANRFATIILIVVILITGLGAVTAKAESNVQEISNEGVDIFVLLDQSESMAITDPAGIRIDTVLYLIDYLQVYASSHPTATSRISVVGFGSKDRTRTMIPLSIVPANPAIGQDPILEKLKIQVVSENLGATNVESALNQVEQQLSQQSDTSSNRQRVLILISDGLPFDSSTAPDPGYTSNFAAIKNRYTSIRSQYPGKWDLITVGIDKRNEYWNQKVEKMWLEIATAAVPVSQVDELKATIVNLLSPILGLSGHIYSPQEEITVEPYLDFVVFSILKHTKLNEIEINYKDADGNVLSIDPKQTGVTLQERSSYDLWIVRNPYAGPWVISSEQPVEIFKQGIFASPQIVLPDSNLPVNLPFYLRFDLSTYDSSDVPFPLTWEVTVTPPDNSTTPIEVDGNPSGTTFQSTLPYFPIQPGTYHVRAKAAAAIGENNEPVNLFDVQTTFLVYQTSIDLSPVSPYSDYEPLADLTIRLMDDNGVPVKTDSSVKMSPVLRVSSADGQARAISLKVIDNATYQLTSPVVLNGVNKIELLIKDNFEHDIIVNGTAINTVHKLELVSPNPAVPENSFIKTIAVRLLDTNNVAFVPSDAFGLRLRATVIPIENANPVSILLNYDPNQQLYVSDSTVLPTNAIGSYRIEVEGLITSNDKEQTTFVETLNYVVTTDLPYFRILKPSVDSVSRYPINLWGRKQGMNVEIEWIQNGTPIDPGAVFINQPGDLVLVDITGPDGITLRDVQLHQLHPENPAKWGTVIPELDHPGEYTATFKFQHAILQSQQPYMSFEPITVKFVRVETIFQVVTQTVQWSLYIIFGLILAVLVYRTIMEFREPFPRGILRIFENDMSRGRTMVDQINLAGWRRRTVTWKLPSSRLPGVGIQRFRIRHLTGHKGKHTQGVSVAAISNNGAQSFRMQFDRGAMEKRIPGRVAEARTYYTIEYTPPAETGRK